MKHLFNFTLLLLVALLLPASALAYDFEVNGIYYNIINNNEVEVTYQHNGSYYEAGHEPTYSGNVIIPATVSYNGITYSVTVIGEGAFYDCSSLTNITIPKSIKRIRELAFLGCIELCRVYINNLESWCNIFFEPGGEEYGKKISLSKDDSNYIRYRANPCFYANHLFLNETEITNLVIPNSITTVNEGAFIGCTAITSVTIPSTITSINSFAFYGCTGIKNLTWNAINCISNGNMSTSNIEQVTIGNEVQVLPYYFVQDSRITNISIPNTVTTIGEWAFNGCNGITSITIPNSVITIGNSAFASCPNLKNVYSQIENPSNISLGNNSFYLTDSWRYALRTLHIPLGSTAAYQASDWYKYFGSFIEMDNGGLITSIEIDKKAATVIEGETLQLAAIIMPEDATNKIVTWASSNPNVATVDENGLVTAVGLGTATITAMTTDGSNLSASSQVTVTSESTTCGFVIRNAEVLHGESIVIPVAMVNDQPIFAFQTDVYLPEGFSLATNPIMEPLVTPSERLTNDHEIMASDYNGAVRIICYTPNAMPIEGNEGDLFYITVMVPEDAAGDYAIYLRNSRLTTADYTELRVPDAGALLTVKTYIPGDVNDSRSVNVADIVATAMYVMEMEPSPFIFDAADMNADGEITVTDIMLIARTILYPEGMNAPRHAPAFSSNNDRMSGEVITTGATRKVSILLDNEMDYSAFQLDLALPEGLTASNFQLTDRAGDHVLDVNTLTNGKTRVLCYTPAIQAIDGHEGAVLTFDVATNGTALGDITVDGIELVTTACEMVRLNAFTIGVNNITAVNEVATGKTVALVDYYNVAGQRLAQPEHGVTLQVTTYTDGTRTTTKLIQ